MALVQGGEKDQEVKDGRELTMSGAMQMASFDKKKDVDELYLWGAHRSEYISMANVSAAKTVADSGSYWGTSSWYFNPYYNMYTFLPGFGYGMGYGMGYYNPFGYTFWSPYNVYGFINTLPYYYTPYPPVAGHRGGGGTHVANPPTRIPRAVTPATTARQALVASNHAGRAEASAGGFSHGGGGSVSASSVSSAHSASSISMSGHAGGGSGHK